MNYSIYDLLEMRTKRVPGEAYKLQGALAGMDVPFVGNMEFDQSSMSIVIPFASGHRRDGVGDLLEVGGIDTSRHKLNPVVLFDHGKVVSLPVAQAEDPMTREYTVQIDPVEKTARAKAFFYQGKKPIHNEGYEPDKYFPTGQQEYDHALFCEQLYDMMVKRYIRAGSIGYQVIAARDLMPDYEKGTPKGLHLLKTLLLEVSAVVLPANQDTVAKALSLPRVCGKPMSPMLVKSLAPYAPPRKAMMGYEEKAYRGTAYTPRIGDTGGHGTYANDPKTDIGRDNDRLRNQDPILHSATRAENPRNPSPEEEKNLPRQGRKARTPDRYRGDPPTLPGEGYNDSRNIGVGASTANPNSVAGAETIVNLQHHTNQINDAERSRRMAEIQRQHYGLDEEEAEEKNLPSQGRKAKIPERHQGDPPTLPGQGYNNTRNYGVGASSSNPNSVAGAERMSHLAHDTGQVTDEEHLDRLRQISRQHYGMETPEELQEAAEFNESKVDRPHPLQDIPPDERVRRAQKKRLPKQGQKANKKPTYRDVGAVPRVDFYGPADEHADLDQPFAPNAGLYSRSAYIPSTPDDPNTLAGYFAHTYGGDEYDMEARVEADHLATGNRQDIDIGERGPYVPRPHPRDRKRKSIDKLSGGLADNKQPQDFDPAQLKAGIKVEMEHTDDPRLAREIAMDHLSEDPAYYQKLSRMEGKRLPRRGRKANRNIIVGEGPTARLADTPDFDDREPYEVNPVNETSIRSENANYIHGSRIERNRQRAIERADAANIRDLESGKSIKALRKLYGSKARPYSMGPDRQKEVDQVITNPNLSDNERSAEIGRITGRAAPLFEAQVLETITDEANEAISGNKSQPSDAISKEKARQILKDGEVHGHPLTEKQRRMFGAAAGKSSDSTPVPETPVPQMPNRPTLNESVEQMDNEAHRNNTEARLLAERYGISPPPAQMPVSSGLRTGLRIPSRGKSIKALRKLYGSKAYRDPNSDLNDPKTETGARAKRGRERYGEHTDYAYVPEREPHTQRLPELPNNQEERDARAHNINENLPTEVRESFKRVTKSRKRPNESNQEYADRMSEEESNNANRQFGQRMEDYHNAAAQGPTDHHHSITQHYGDEMHSGIGDFNLAMHARQRNHNRRLQGGKTFKQGNVPVPHGDLSKTKVPPAKWKPGLGAIKSADEENRAARLDIENASRAINHEGNNDFYDANFGSRTDQRNERRRIINNAHNARTAGNIGVVYEHLSKLPKKEETRYPPGYQGDSTQKRMKSAKDGKAMDIFSGATHGKIRKYTDHAFRSHQSGQITDDQLRERLDKVNRVLRNMDTVRSEHRTQVENQRDAHNQSAVSGNTLGDVQKPSTKDIRSLYSKKSRSKPGYEQHLEETRGTSAAGKPEKGKVSAQYGPRADSVVDKEANEFELNPDWANIDLSELEKSVNTLRKMYGMKSDEDMTERYDRPRSRRPHKGKSPSALISEYYQLSRERHEDAFGPPNKEAIEGGLTTYDDRRRDRDERQEAVSAELRRPQRNN